MAAMIDLRSDTVTKPTAAMRAAMAAASRGVNMRWWEAAKGGGRRGRGAFTRLPSRVSPGLRGLLGCYDSLPL